MILVKKSVIFFKSQVYKIMITFLAPELAQWYSGASLSNLVSVPANEPRAGANQNLKASQPEPPVEKSQPRLAFRPQAKLG